ncbi:hypothetical protein K2173_005251 [Erythroxylum novogranatense]|uniref:SOSEKI DIX-like domain-containing protein n=1 Tax=Erythroxylum novogranatense TaxID=1862640 RepID=A0AAV8TSA6_9ROSI|nr:hypothetical protein K2173_005251 [Erythroxylum novogranatense]
MEGRPRSGRERENSPDRAKVCMQREKLVKPVKKVQVVYYLSRNGQLEHPHYMEVPRLANQPLRLRDVIDRLTVLRGKGMPSLYSWSCKRSYKNGYVWNDLAESDVIYPSEGAEYVLKGSELVEGSSERFQLLHVNNSRQSIQEPNVVHTKRKQLSSSSQSRKLEATQNAKYEYQEYEEEEEEDLEESPEEYEDEEKTSYTSSTTPHSRCSRGVSTDELEERPTNINLTTNKDSTNHISSPQPAPPSVLSGQPTQNIPTKTTTNASTTPKRFEDGDPVPVQSTTSRNSVLLHLISCGNLTIPKTKNSMSTIRPPVKMNSDISIRRSETDLHRGVLCKSAVKVVEEDIINYMSENPRFGNLQAEEKEYFSGSIVESMSENRAMSLTEAELKRSNSYKEERTTKAETKDTVEDIKDRAAMRGKCIPRKKPSCLAKQNKKRNE